MTQKTDPSADEVYFLGLWSTLKSDEDYPGLASFIMDKNADLKASLTELKDSISGDIPPEAKDTFERLIASICHPPPGCIPEA